MDELEEFRTLRKTGMRANNRAAAQDVRLTLKRLHAEVSVIILSFSSAYASFPDR